MVVHCTVKDISATDKCDTERNQNKQIFFMLTYSKLLPTQFNQKLCSNIVHFIPDGIK